MKIFGFTLEREGKSKVGKMKNLPQPPKSKQNNQRKKKNVSVPAGRVSVPSKVYDEHLLNNIKGNLNLIKPDFTFEAIPLIRKLYKINEDIGLALFDLIQLTNTGHDIKFKQDAPPELADEMRAHLQKVSKTWHVGSAGINGLVNKWIAQIYVSGALSVEWVANKYLTGVDQCAMVNPETIRCGMVKGRYKFYQKSSLIGNSFSGYIELNPITYQYFGLFSDEDTPYGVPPFLAALKAISTQKDMKDNIHHILNQLGLLGYLETKLEKPDQQANERDDTYMTRLNKLLSDTKRNIIQGFKEGVVVGFREDHEFEFHSTTKNLNGVTDLFNMNENQIANGLKTSPAFLGVKSGSTESFLSIVFTKTLSQLKNVQQILSEALFRGYELELMLAGYDSNYLDTVEFRPSTVTDDLKLQQGKEVKQRVLHALWIDRIISSEQYAEEMGYTKPFDIIEPPKPGEVSNPDAAKKQKREDDKNKSDRKVRDKNKPQPKRKDNNTKPQ